MICPGECSLNMYEKNMYSAVDGCSVLYVSIRSNHFIMFKSSVPLLIFCLVILYIIKSRILNPTIIVLLSISCFNSVHVCFVYLGTLMLGAYIFIIVTSFIVWNWPFYHYIMFLITVLDLNSILPDTSMVTPALFWLPFNFSILLLFAYVYIYI